MSSEYQRLLRDFSVHVGLTSAETFLEHELLVVDKLPIHFSEQMGDMGPEVWYFSPLGPMPSPARAEHYLALLEANDFWIETHGATISLQKGTGQARLSSRQPLIGTSVAALAGGVGRLATAALELQKLIRDMSPATARVSDTAPYDTGHLPNLA